MFFFGLLAKPPFFKKTKGKLQNFPKHFFWETPKTIVQKYGLGFLNFFWGKKPPPKNSLNFKNFWVMIFPRPNTPFFQKTFFFNFFSGKNPSFQNIH